MATFSITLVMDSDIYFHPKLSFEMETSQLTNANLRYTNINKTLRYLVSWNRKVLEKVNAIT